MPPSSILKIAEKFDIAAGIGLAAGLLATALTYIHYENLDAAAPKISQTQAAKSGALIVLTGGKDRVKTALKLCRADQKLFISGCGPIIKNMDRDRELAMIIEVCGLFLKDLELNPENVHLGHDALTTQGNAEEIAIWLEENPCITRITIVTSGYHIPRTLLHIQNKLPADINVNFYEVPGCDVGCKVIAGEAVKTMLESIHDNFPAVR